MIQHGENFQCQSYAVKSIKIHASGVNPSRYQISQRLGWNHDSRCAQSFPSGMSRRDRQRGEGVKLPAIGEWVWSAKRATTAGLAPAV